MLFKTYEHQVLSECCDIFLHIFICFFNFFYSILYMFLLHEKQYNVRRTFNHQFISKRTTVFTLYQTRKYSFFLLLFWVQSFSVVNRVKIKCYKNVTSYLLSSFTQGLFFIAHGSYLNSDSRFREILSSTFNTTTYCLLANQV